MSTKAFSTIHDFIQTYGDIYTAIDSIVSELQSGQEYANADCNVTTAIDCLEKAKILLGRFEGKVNPE